MMKTSARLIFDRLQLRVEGHGVDVAILRWDEVKEIFAFKDDVFAYDIICIGFRLDDEGTYFRIDEENEKYRDFLAFLPTVFSGVRIDFFSDVTFPAFATCLTSLRGEKRIELIWKSQTEQ